MQHTSKDNLFRNIIDIVQIEDIKHRWTPIEYRNYTAPDFKNLYENSLKEIGDKEAVAIYNANNLSEKIINEIKRLKAERVKNIMVFVPNIDQVKLLLELYPNAGGIFSGMLASKRKKILTDFKSGVMMLSSIVIF